MSAMYLGYVSLRTKPPTSQALQLVYFSHNYQLLVFNDAVAFVLANSLGDWIKGVGQLTGHGVGLAGSVLKQLHPAQLPGSLAQLPRDLSVNDLREMNLKADSVSIESISSLRITTAFRPITQIGGVDLSFKFTPKNKYQYVKFHITSDPSAGVQLLLQSLPSFKIADKRIARR